MAGMAATHGTFVVRHESDDIMMEKGPTVTSEEAAEERETMRAHRRTIGAAVIDVFIAILPLYFIVFAALSYMRDGTLASSFRNQALFRMAAFNPTLFPVVFTLIVAKLIKAVATWRLEQGATVGLIQLLLGSRSLVSSVLTPWKLRSLSFLVPVIVLLWILNPVGGQTSLRVVSKASNYTIVDTPFAYVDRDATPYSPIPIAYPPFVKAATSAFNMALFSPSSSKNGTQDLFGNVQIPMLEYMKPHQAPDAEGWYSTAGRNLTGAYAALATALDVPKPKHKLVYSALVGLPFVRNDSLTQAEAISTNTTDDATALDPKLQAIKEELFGDDLVNMKQLFNVETSYLHAECSVQNVSPSGPSNITDANYLQSNLSNWATSTSVVSNGQGLSIDIGSTHNVSSTEPRRIGLESWLAFSSDTGAAELEVTLSEAWCNLTTTYVEAQIYCTTEKNCTVSKICESTNSRSSSALTILDGITNPNYALPDSAYYAAKVAPEFFQTFILATANETHGATTLTPLQSYFADTVSPFRSAIGDSFTEKQTPLYEIGDELFFTRFTQLLNTWMMASRDSYTLTGVIDIAASDDSTSIAVTKSSNGQISVEKTVLRCHKIFFASFVVVSSILFGMGLAIACLDATRKGPDVLDDFVNSIRHSPYVHVEQEPSMEDGQDKARRLKNTVIQIGDVRPDSSIGYVAIGTPNARQPVERLDHTRRYHYLAALNFLTM